MSVIQTALNVRGDTFTPLPGARHDAITLVNRFSNSRALLGKEAQESEVKALAPQYRYLHFATHGMSSDIAPLFSMLVLSPPTDATNSANAIRPSDDGYLTAREIMDLDLSHCELATLIACNTARGQQRRGEGVIGLTWALSVAGCSSQVVALWSISDGSASQCMTRFYDGIQRGLPKAAALREAALAVQKTPGYSHPYHWAPYLLFSAE